MGLFRCTFGCGQENAGACQPIEAKDRYIARQKMFEMHGNKWCTEYDETQWEDNKRKADMYGYRLEYDLPTITVDETEVREKWPELL